MATSKEYRDYILEQLDLLQDITAKSMMGEYLLYYQGQLFGGIYDNQLLIKNTEVGKSLMTEVKEVLPYEGSKKKMLLISEIENKEFLKELITKTCEELKDK